MGDNDRPTAGQLASYGSTPTTAGRLGRPPVRGAAGRVVRTDWGAVLVATSQELLHVDVPVGMDPAPVTGDWVVLGGQPAALRRVASRASTLARRDDASSQTLAAHVDGVFELCTLDRALVLASDCGAVPAIVLTKADRCADPDVPVGDGAVLVDTPGLRALGSPGSTTASPARSRAVTDPLPAAAGRTAENTSRLAREG